MSYVTSVLQPGEKIRHVTKIHWIMYVPGLVFIVLGGAAYWMGVQPVSAYWLWVAVSLFLFACAAVLLFRAWFQRWTTEIAVTDRRIIYKKGFIRRQTTEMQLDKVESVDVNQSIMGRILDYGEIVIRGFGVGLVMLPNIDGPIEFRNHVTAQ
jgi:uncharacterized membrane protein YdbT with pleckstrin-like domain